MVSYPLPLVLQQNLIQNGFGTRLLLVCCIFNEPFFVKQYFYSSSQHSNTHDF